MVWYAEQINQIRSAGGISGISPNCVPTLAGFFIGVDMTNSPLIVDETGNKYGRLRVIKRGANDKNGSARWLCRCDCGVEKIIRGRSLRFGGTNGAGTKSCGCYSREVTSKRMKLLRGEKSYGWKGGRCNHHGKDGYVLLHKPNHLLSNKGGYVLEHVYIMSEHLNRLIEKEETIHHKNGIKNDNRIENLELWTNRHSSGQRVSDMVAFAKDILKRYEPSALKGKNNERIKRTNRIG